MVWKKVGILFGSVWNGLFMKDRTLKIKNTDRALFCRLIRPGAVLLTRTVKDSFLSRIIQWVTCGNWTHVVVYLGKSFGKYRLFHETIEAISEGVRSQVLDKYLNGKYQIEAWMRDLSDKELTVMCEYLYGREGKAKYDYHGLLSPITLFEQDPDSDYCSELIFNTYEVTGEKCCLKEVEPKIMVSPNDLRRYFVSSSRWYMVTFYC